MGQVSCSGRSGTLTSTYFERVRVIASDLFGIPPQAISAQSSPENIESWDSVQHFNFILALEEAFHLQLSAEETERIRTIGDAEKLIAEKVAGTGG
jgi:acyl carrier protein